MDREKVIKKAERIMCSTVDRDMIDSFCEDVIALLKEQEAVEPSTDEYGNKRCGNCGYKLQSIADQDLFCCKCGKPVLWEGR